MPIRGFESLGVMGLEEIVQFLRRRRRRRQWAWAPVPTSGRWIGLFPKKTQSSKQMHVLCYIASKRV